MRVKKARTFVASALVFCLGSVAFISTKLDSVEEPLSITPYKYDRQRVINTPYKKWNTGTKAEKGQDKNEEFTITFLGDTMVGNMEHNFAASDTRSIEEAFSKVKPLLHKDDYVICNLEGPITSLGRKFDPYHRKPAYSFNMDPLVATTLKRIGVNAASLANNHYFDRGSQGVQETMGSLTEAGIEFFGLGETVMEAAQPLIVPTKFKGINIGIAGFSERYSAGKRAGEDDAQSLGFLLPTPVDARLATDLLKQKGVTKKVAFVHWGRNYVSSVDDSNLRQKAQYLVDAGFDMIVGSDGAHLVQEFDFVSGVPVLYNVGNFVFHTPGRFQSRDDDSNGAKPLPFGTATRLMVGEDGSFKRMEIHCIAVDNRSVAYIPRPCTPQESRRLFSSMGRHVHNHLGANVATIDLE